MDDLKGYPFAVEDSAALPMSLTKQITYIILRAFKARAQK